MGRIPAEVLPIRSAQKKRFPTVLCGVGILLFVAAEVALCVGVGRWLGWHFVMNVCIATGVLGLFVIGLAVSALRHHRGPPLRPGRVS